MNKLGINTVANIITKLWSLVSIYLFIPLYIKFLGETAYGLVSFFATLQMTLNLLGLGLSNTLRREFAVGEDSNNNNIRKYKLLRSVEVIYLFLGIIIIAICCNGAKYISEQWLNIEDLDPTVVSKVIALMGISIALQLLANLYSGCLFGLNCQVLANSLCVAWSIAKCVGSLLIIWVIEPNLIYFYGWHIFVDAIYLLLLRFYSIQKLNLIKKEWGLQDFANIKTIWRYTCGILFISIIALINKQLDKVIISNFLSLTELGAYNVATTLGSLTSIIPAALYIAVFPRFTNYATTDNRTDLNSEFFQLNKIVNIIVSSMAAYIAVYAVPLIRVWTGSDAYATILGSVGTLVVLAVSFIEFQEIPYALALAHGNTRYNVIIGALFIPVIVISTYYGIKNYGLFGAGVVYLVLMAGQTLIYEFMIYKKYICNNPIKMIIRDTIVPIILCLVLAYISYLFIKSVSGNALIQSGFAVICGMVTLAVVMMIFARDEIDKFIRNKD